MRRSCLYTPSSTTTTTTISPRTMPSSPFQRLPSLWLEFPVSLFRTTSSSSAAHRLACPLFIHICAHSNLYTGSTRSYTPVKVLGDGSFGTVWLCDWHGILPPNTPLSPMQCGAGARPDWAGMRLVAVKRMKKQWEGGWDECQKNSELRVRISLSCSKPHVPIGFPLSSHCVQYLIIQT